ncbi:hypothetical protein L7F22_051176 [Adiantum nelumboides]|nr:hypothetical protein [Adiantum nelumboides]
MSVRGPRCGKHPSHVLVGVCAFCLRERLAGLAGIECASDSSHTHNSRKKKQSPGRSHAAHGSHKQSSEKRSDERRPSNVCVKPIVNRGSQDDRVFASHLHAVTSTKEPMAHATVKKLNKLSFSKTLSMASTSKAYEPISANIPEPNDARGSDIDTSIHLSTISDTACESASVEMPAVWHSFSSTHANSSKVRPPDIKLPILENDQQTKINSMTNMQLQKHTTVGCRSSLHRIAEQAKRVSLVKPVHSAALSDSERNSFNAVQGARSLPLPATIVNGKNEEIVLAVSPNLKQKKKKTLSSLFSLDDADFPSSKSKTEDSRSRSNAEQDVLSDGSASVPAQSTLQAKTMQRRCKHGSFSERVEPSTYLFPVPEAANSRPLTWLSSLFRRRKKKSFPKSGEALKSFSEHNNGWEDARQSWEAPRLSSWEQFRFSSFEGPRSSWEPSRPSWEGVMRTSDCESVVSGFDYPPEKLVDVRELTQRNNREQSTVDLTNVFSDARRSLDSKRLGLKPKPLAPKTTQIDDKDRAHSFLPAKVTSMQRDVSTQTTPPRVSDATEIFLQQRLQRSRHHRGQHYAKASHAVWSKVWTKTFLNSRWAFTQRHQKERTPDEMGDAMVPLPEAREQGNLTSGRSSFHEGTNIASNYHSKFTCINNIEEHAACNAFRSPLQQGRELLTRLDSKGDTCIQTDEQSDKARDSNFAVENGLLKFYLTPVRGHSKSKREVHGLS